MRRALVAVAAVLCLAPAAPAEAKEGVRAHLESRLPANAKPGATIRIVWSLYYLENGTKRPFGASQLFVRLRGKTGRFVKEYGEGRAGRYKARIKVPSGGIRSIRFGLEGMRIYPGGRTEPAPVYFPLDNDPFAKR